jgi:agmatine deiminase
MDDQIAGKILEAERADRYRAPIIAEMGGIQCDGEGTVLTTEQCLLNVNRNAHLGKEAVTQHLLDYLGARKIIWLPRGCKFDETDGHIDDLACFVRPGEVVMQWTDDTSDPQYEIYQEAYAILSSTTDAKGRPLKIHKMLAPEALVWTAEESAGLDHGDAAIARVAGTRICASYINYYVGNGVVVVPEFGDVNDMPAQRLLAELFPRHRIIGIPNTREILLGGGNIACITSPQYAAQTR